MDEQSMGRPLSLRQSQAFWPFPDSRQPLRLSDDQQTDAEPSPVDTNPLLWAISGRDGLDFRLPALGDWH